MLRPENRRSSPLSLGRKALAVGDGRKERSEWSPSQYYDILCNKRRQRHKRQMSTTLPNDRTTSPKANQDETMGSHDPDVAEQKRLRARALEIGNTLDVGAEDELRHLLECRFPEVRRLAASALGKLAPRRPNETLVSEALARVAETDDHPQVRQYALKALAKYPVASISLLDRLRDIARDPNLRDYVRAAAAETIAEAQKANRQAYARKHHWYTRCHRIIGEEEFMKGMELFGKPYCQHCLDERILESKNFELVVDDAKTRRTEDGTAVQSLGERRIADFLAQKRIAYVYDERYRMAGDVRIRPDFYLPEFDLYIEYWGMDTPEYVANMKKKLFLYQRAGKKLISLSFRDFNRLEALLEEKLSRYIQL